MLNRVLCLFNKHTPKRSTAHWDGLNYVGDCRHCGHHIRRKSRGNWKSDWINGHQARPIKPPHSSG